MISLGDFGLYILTLYDVIFHLVKSILSLDFNSLGGLLRNGVGIEFGNLNSPAAAIMAIATLSVSIALFASTTYIPTIMNLLFLFLYPVWSISSTLISYLFANMMIIITSSKRIFGLRVSSFVVGCIVSAAIFCIEIAIANILNISGYTSDFR